MRIYARENRLWLPVSAYLIEHPKGLFLVDTGWARAMSPEGVFDKKAQIKSLGTVVLYEVNQGQIPLGQCVDEQLAEMGIKTSDIDAVNWPARLRSFHWPLRGKRATIGVKA